MRRKTGLFVISTIILVGFLFARQMGWTQDVTGVIVDAKTAREAEALLMTPVCEDAADFKSIRKFDVLRAYPKRAVRRGIEGRVTAMLRVDDTGEVRDVMILENKPVGAFDAAVEREAMKMLYEPAEPACKGKIREADLQVEFKLHD